MKSVFIARRWRVPKVIIGLSCIEFCLTVAVLALFGIADPNLYRTKLWQDGSDNGFNSNPNEILYSYANYRPISTPLVWSQFITSYNVVIAVLSMFLLLVKSVMFVVHAWIPLLSAIVHALLVALYAYSTYAQSSKDMSDPLHPQPGAPWYITKSCHAVYTPGNYGYCQQAKASFGVTICMLVLFVAYLALSIWSAVPTQAEKAERDSDIEFEKITKYRPQPNGAVAGEQWREMGDMHAPPARTPTAATEASPQPKTPPAASFHRLDGVPGSSTGPSRTLPFREQFSADAPDER